MQSTVGSALEKLATHFPELWEDLTGEALGKTAKDEKGEMQGDEIEKKLETTTPGGGSAKVERRQQKRKRRSKSKGKMKRFLNKATKRKGALRRFYGVKEGESIPIKKMVEDRRRLMRKENKTEKEVKLLRRIVLALNMRQFQKGKEEGEEKGKGGDKKASQTLDPTLRRIEGRCLRTAREEPERRAEMLSVMLKMEAFC